MMTLIRKLLGGLLGDSAWLVLLVVAATAAYFYVQLRTTRAEHDLLTQWAEVTCAASGTTFAGEGPVKSGTNCRQHVAALAAFRRDTDAASAATLATALADHAARQNSDNRAARTAAEAARSAAERMEAADAEAERRNIVDREWFAAVNGVAGLHAVDR